MILHKRYQRLAKNWLKNNHMVYLYPSAKNPGMLIAHGVKLYVDGVPIKYSFILHPRGYE